MPSWKKMAEAFGRATRGRNNAENPAIKAARDSYGRDLNNYSADKNARDRAESFHAGEEERWLERDKDADAFEDKLSDKRLAKEFEDAFNEVVDRHSTKVPDDAKRIYDNYDFDFERAYGPDDAYRRAVRKSKVEDAPSSTGDFEERFGFDISDEMPPDNYDEIRAKMIEELKSGIDLSDFFEKYRK